jgi:hypothetical protein
MIGNAPLETLQVKWAKQICSTPVISNIRGDESVFKARNMPAPHIQIQILTNVVSEKRQSNLKPGVEKFRIQPESGRRYVMRSVSFDLWRRTAQGKETVCRRQYYDHVYVYGFQEDLDNLDLRTQDTRSPLQKYLPGLSFDNLN